ncbi:hypothetical protein MUB04_14795 [Acinetobacter indicus]|uniref:hypothetical protein n=1 Tax=Acinetobacter TaxID=469 RepID=UPI0015D442EE|nr:MULTISPECIES: hypothetical protein [Acinetobacter]MCP0917801.1 hypothetical protein [Acinetobacter indicus]
MQNSNHQDQIGEDDELDISEDEAEQQRKEQIRRRIKARNQFRSPWFALGVVFILFIMIYPRCTYKDNVRKEMERKAQNQAEIQKNPPLQHRQTSEEEQGMVPKF